MQLINTSVNFYRSIVKVKKLFKNKHFQGNRIKKNLTYEV